MTRREWDSPDYRPPRFVDTGDPRQASASDLLIGQTSRRFHHLMDAAMLVSFYKYGDVADAYPTKVNAVASLQTRLHYYLHGKKNPSFGDEGEPEYLVPPGNVEYLVDAANFAMIEFMYPAHPDAHFKATDSDGSPGRIAQNTAIYDAAIPFKNSDVEPASLERPSPTSNEPK